RPRLTPFPYASLFRSRGAGAALWNGGVAVPGITDLNIIAPLVALTAGGLVVIVADLVTPRRLARPWTYGVAAAAVLVTAWYVAAAWQAVQAGPLTAFAGGDVVDKRSVALAGLLLVGAVSVV